MKSKKRAMLLVLLPLAILVVAVGVSYLSDTENPQYAYFLFVYGIIFGISFLAFVFKLLFRFFIR